jgi:uncharacterized lipoprotein YddW (UPF0748 family)
VLSSPLLRYLAPAALLLLIAGCTTPPRPVAGEPPAVPREFRGVWVATVNNIDWPSRPGLPAAQQRAEITALLDRAQALGLNAVIFQVRPATDALYASSLEPWSEYLTGTQGRDPGYDPLAVWIEEAHRRGLELHAWFNPYRARHHEAKSPLAPNHLSRTQPHLVKKYGDLLWLDPGEPAAAAHTLAVIRDVVRRYDIDGVHLDDYFYPYPVTAPLPPKAPKDAKPQELDFPDEPSRKKYLAAGGRLPVPDWRRDNVNRLVEQIHRAVRAEKPWVKFGISPFGLGRPDRRPPGIKGFSQYDKLYADVELWLERGWADYFVPQLYWPLAQQEQSYPVLLDYWLAQNPAGRHVWPGLFTSAISDEKKWPLTDIPQQISLTRQRPAATGHVHFSMVALMDNRRDINSRLAPLYATPALVPASPWLGLPVPAAPALKRTGRTVQLTPPAGAARLIIWQQIGAEWRFTLHPATLKELTPDPAATAVVVSALNRAGVEGPRTPLSLPAPKKRK